MSDPTRGEGALKLLNIFLCMRACVLVKICFGHSGSHFTQRTRHQCQSRLLQCVTAFPMAVPILSEAWVLVWASQRPVKLIWSVLSPFFVEMNAIIYIYSILFSFNIIFFTHKYNRPYNVPKCVYEVQVGGDCDGFEGWGKFVVRGFPAFHLWVTHLCVIQKHGVCDLFNNCVGRGDCHQQLS